MIEIDNYTKKFTDMMSEGFIFIDNEGKIQIYNNKAKEIFGLENKFEYSHIAGKLNKGDIVIIGDNLIGGDDGGLTPEALSIIGIHDKEIKENDAIVAIGYFDDDKSIPIYKHAKYNNSFDNLELSTVLNDIRISVEIDFSNRNITITVNDIKYIFPYIYCIGHMVVIEPKMKKMKFYQTHGYTARGEAINELLMGKSFRAKGEVPEFFDVIGKDIFDIHSTNMTIKEFYEAAKGDDISYINQFKEINGKQTICSLYPVNSNDKRAGAALKIEDISEIKKIIRERDEAFEKLVLMERRLNEEVNLKALLPEIVGDSIQIDALKKLAFKASKTNSTVLILGESGTGKSMLAKIIHENSKNKDKPFVNVNCGSITETLLESELFGYEGGAFTGAKGEGKIGIFESANGGTIFLDEIAEISPQLQVKLLQVLQDRSFYRVGGNKKINVVIRVIVATNKNLEEQILKNKFREDLYYRINVFPITIPPLRDRKNDIYPLVKSILPKICSKVGCDEKTISSEAINQLIKYNWPGNIRELENVIERAINISEGQVILSKHLYINNRVQNSFEQQRTLRELLDEAEKNAIKRALIKSNKDKKAAMNALQVSKTTFYEKLKKYNIELEHSELTE